MSVRSFKSFLIIAIGTATIAFGVINFSVTSNLASGGLTGITLILFHLFGFSPGVTTLLINIPLAILLYRFTSKQAVFLTVYGFVSLSAFLSLFELIGPLMPNLQDDMILASIGFGVTVGVGTGLIFQQEGTTGGAAIVAKLLKDIWGIPVTKTFLYFDSIVIVASLFFFLDFISAIYSLIGLYVSTLVITKVQEGFVSGYKVLIFSDHHEKIGSLIIEKLQRGVTYVHGTGAYSQDEKNVILTVIHKKQLITLKRIIHEIDPQCFVSVSHTYETLGEGFTFENHERGT